jgi:AcrR family transcriptional regulator
MSSTRTGDKLRDLLDGALEVFSADGYTRASVDNIARAAGVSSRTIYNRFGDKAALFEAVILDSAQHVAAAQIALVDRYLGRPVDLAVDLHEFGHAWATSRTRFGPHFALVRQIDAELAHVPESALRAWRAAGPLRVRAALADRLRRLSDAGLLLIDDADLAAVHLVRLVVGDLEDRAYDGVPVPRSEVNRVADAGVDVFLRAYRAV